MHRDRQAQFLHDVGHRSGLLADRLAERNLQIVPQNGQHHSRNPPAGADVQHGLARAEKTGEGLAVDQVPADELLEIGMPGEVDLAVPIPQQPAILIEPGDLPLRKFDVVSLQGGGQIVVGGIHGGTELEVELDAE